MGLAPLKFRFISVKAMLPVRTKSRTGKSADSAAFVMDKLPTGKDVEGEYVVAIYVQGSVCKSICLLFLI
jgi:hypothetical protein